MASGLISGPAAALSCYGCYASAMSPLALAIAHLQIFFVDARIFSGNILRYLISNAAQ